MASIMRADQDAAGVRRHASPALDARLASLTILDRDDADSLSMLIQREVIPRLMVAHAPARPMPPPDVCGATIGPADVEALAALALQGEADALLAQVDASVARGAQMDTVLVELLAPAARLLGEYWESDRADFLDVTMALWRLQEAVHQLAARCPARTMPGTGGRCALFATMPGEQHSFGTVVIDELFRGDGWQTERMCEPTTPELLRRAADGWFDMIGLTVSCDCHIAPLASLVAALRNVSRNPCVCVMVGGRVFAADPGLAVQVGADGTARDARLALQLASGLVVARQREALVCS